LSEERRRKWDKYRDRLSDRGAGGSTGERNQEKHVHAASDRQEPFNRKARNTPRPLSETSETGTKKWKYITRPYFVPILCLSFLFYADCIIIVRPEESL